MGSLIQAWHVLLKRIQPLLFPTVRRSVTQMGTVIQTSPCAQTVSFICFNLMVFWCIECCLTNCDFRSLCQKLPSSRYRIHSRAIGDICLPRRNSNWGLRIQTRNYFMQRGDRRNTILWLQGGVSNSKMHPRQVIAKPDMCSFQAIHLISVHSKLLQIINKMIFFAIQAVWVIRNVAMRFALPLPTMTRHVTPTIVHMTNAANP